MSEEKFSRAVLLLLKLRAVLVLVALLVTFSALAPEFLSVNNLSILTKHVAINAILAIGMTFVILAGGIDLSVGSVAGLAGMVAGGMLTVGIAGHVAGVWMAVLLALLVSCFVGLLNGVLVTRLGVAPFIATLGRFILRAALRCWSRMGRRFLILLGRRLGVRLDSRSLGKVFFWVCRYRCG